MLDRLFKLFAIADNGLLKALVTSAQFLVLFLALAASELALLSKHLGIMLGALQGHTQFAFALSCFSFFC